MLAAVSADKDGALGTLKLILQMEASGRTYSVALENYLNKVIKQSLQLIERPEELSGDALAEALSLALYVRTDTGLRVSLEQVLKDDCSESDKAASASMALKSLENGFDARRELTHFSGGVYAAI